MVLSYKIYKESDMFQLKCIVSDVDGNKYCVRERNKLELAADLLAQACERCKQLVRYVGEKHPTNVDVKRLVENFNPKTNYKCFLFWCHFYFITTNRSTIL